MQSFHFTRLPLITVTHQRRSTRIQMPYPTIITYHGTRTTMPEMDFPDGPDLQMDKRKVGNCIQSSTISGPCKTDQTTAGTTNDCDLTAWMLTTILSRPNYTDSMIDKISHGCNPAWTPVYPQTSFSQSDITTTNNNCSTSIIYQSTTTANTNQQATTVTYSPDNVQTIQPYYTSIKPRINYHPKGLCTCTCKCCP